MSLPPERRPLRIAKARPLAGFRHQPDCFFVDLWGSRTQFGGLTCESGRGEASGSSH
jgi:hypothetical protein